MDLIKFWITKRKKWRKTEQEMQLWWGKLENMFRDYSLKQKSRTWSLYSTSGRVSIRSSRPRSTCSRCWCCLSSTSGNSPHSCALQDTGAEDFCLNLELQCMCRSRICFQGARGLMVFACPRRRKQIDQSREAFSDAYALLDLRLQFFFLNYSVRLVTVFKNSRGMLKNVIHKQELKVR